MHTIQVKVDILLCLAIFHIPVEQPVVQLVKVHIVGLHGIVLLHDHIDIVLRVEVLELSQVDVLVLASLHKKRGPELG